MTPCANIKSLRYRRHVRVEDFYDAREGARSIYVTTIMPCGRALLPLPARGVGAEPWVDGRARNPSHLLDDYSVLGKGLKYIRFD